MGSGAGAGQQQQFQIWTSLVFPLFSGLTARSRANGEVVSIAPVKAFNKKAGGEGRLQTVLIDV